MAYAHHFLGEPSQRTLPFIEEFNKFIHWLWGKSENSDTLQGMEESSWP